MSEEKNQNEIEEVTNEDEHKDVEHYCYLCRRPESAAGKMLELPNNIFICTDCMQRTLNSMGNGQFGFIDARNMDLDSMDITKMMNDMQSMQPKAEVKKKKKEIDVAVIEVTEEYLKEKLYKIRGKRVLLDADLAEIYGYDTKGFNRQVKNNIEKFDEDFMFELTDEELEDLRYKNCTANISSKSRYNPHVFTEQGLYMLMTVLKGPLAVKQSKALIRTFKKMKDYNIL